MPKVSVIIPVYGVEKYIERCARSLFEQTLDDIEFIFVDDCTKDNSIAVLLHVLDDYPNRKAQTHIVHHEVNKGLPSARRTGIQIAKGEYIAHCDSDDWVDVAMYEKMYKKAKEENLDMVISNYYISDGISKTPYHEEAMRNDKALLYFEYINIWVKLVRSSIYQENSFEPVKATMLEDRALSVQLTYYCKSIGFIDEPLYYYYKNLESICRVFTKDCCIKRYNEAISNVNLIIEFMESKEIAQLFHTEICRLKFVARHQIAPVTNDSDCYSIWRKTYPEINTVFIFSSQVSFSEKIRFILTYCHLFPYLRNKISKLS